MATAWAWSACPSRRAVGWPGAGAEVSAADVARGNRHEAERPEQDPGPITKINHGEATANVVMDAGGVRLVASVTVEAVQELALTVGSQVTAVVKASDVILAVD